MYPFLCPLILKVALFEDQLNNGLGNQKEAFERLQSMRQFRQTINCANASKLS